MTCHFSATVKVADVFSAELELSILLWGPCLSCTSNDPSAGLNLQPVFGDEFCLRGNSPGSSSTAGRKGAMPNPKHKKISRLED